MGVLQSLLQNSHAAVQADQDGLILRALAGDRQVREMAEARVQVPQAAQVQQAELEVQLAELQRLKEELEAQQRAQVVRHAELEVQLAELQKLQEEL